MVYTYISHDKRKKGECIEREDKCVVLRGGNWKDRQIDDQ